MYSSREDPDPGAIPEAQGGLKPVNRVGQAGSGLAASQVSRVALLGSGERMVKAGLRR